MNEIFELISEYDSWFYLITFIWTALEGETFVIFAGLAAQKGMLSIELLFLSAALGSLFGDQICFVIGRLYGRKIIHRYPKIEPKVERVLGLLEKYSTVFILSYRFMYGVRNVSALTIGMSHLTWRRFFVLNTIASFLWSASFCGAGYLMGDLVDEFGIAEGDIRNVMIAILLLVVFLVGTRIYFGQKGLGALETEPESLTESLPNTNEKEPLDARKVKKTGSEG